MALTDNLVSYFKLDNSLTDERGKYTLTGGSSYITGKINNTRTGGTLSISTIPTANNFTGTGSWTINFWFKFTTAGGYFFNSRAAGNDFSIDDGNVLGKLRFLWWDTGGNLDGDLSTAGTWNDGNWHMGTFWFDNSAQKIYIKIDDGTAVEDAVTGTTRITNNQTFTFNEALTGNVDEVGMWNRVLTSAEITALYAAGSGLQYPFGVSLADSCIAYYKLDEASGNAADSVGSNTLTNTNVTYGTGKINNGAVFNSTSDTLIGTSIPNPHAFTFWYNVTANNSRVFLANASPDNTIQSDAVSTPTWLIYDGAANRSFTTTIKNTTWTFIAFIRNGSNYDLYENGSYQESVASNQISFDKIGRSGSDIAGTIDEVGIWSYLSSSDVATLYNSGAGLQYPFSAGGATFIPRVSFIM